MSKDLAICVRNLGKKYIIGGQKERNSTFGEVIANSIKTPFRHIKNFGTETSNNDFWALKDVSFDVYKGEVLGIIGRNGAGKSTLLKILSRITTPSEGKVEIHGRIGSLLEVGTGFHPELTGRENIFLSGSILGMQKREIEEKFEEIVKFSEIEKFLDTPVKRYSSGMYVRLAFAVAAHMDTEILLVDEVLAVGDAEFQKKCLGKMGEAAKEGRTVLFVSHNMNAISRMCDKGLLIDGGKIIDFNEKVDLIINAYLFPKGEKGKVNYWENLEKRFENDYFTPIHMFISDEHMNPLENPIPQNQDTWIIIEGHIKIVDPALEIGYIISNFEGDCLYWSYFNDQPESDWPIFQTGDFVLKSKIPKYFLNEGSYRIDLIGSLRCRTWLFGPVGNSPAINLTIQGGLTDFPYWNNKRPGIVAPALLWVGSKENEKPSLMSCNQGKE
jgi:lipopolysaccharide transport system ATP-binding protein